MEVIAISSPFKGKQLEDALLDFDAIVVDSSCVESMEELRLAGHLTKKAFEQKKSIAKKRKYEFLLWLTGKTDLQSAFKIARPRTQDMLLVVFSGNKKIIVDRLKAKTRNTRLKTRGDPLALERISLSRIRN